MTPDDRDNPDLRELLAKRAMVRDEEVDALREFVRTLPPRRRRPRGLGVLAAAAGIVVLLGLGIVVVNLPLGVSGAAPWPPNPAYFANDPRLAVCNATADDATAIFELQHVSDYAAQLPNAYPLVGLQADPAAPALVIVRKGPGTPQRDGETPAPGSHDLCLVVGADAAHWTPIAVVDVDTDGLEAFKPEPTGTPIAADELPWVNRCGGVEAGILRVIQLAHGTDALTLNSVFVPASAVTDAPTTIVVYDSVHPFAPQGTAPPSGVTFAPRESPGPGQHDLCILAGSDPATATRTIVETGGAMPLAPGIRVPSASAEPNGSATPSSSLQPQISRADCAALGFSDRRCEAVVDQAMRDAGLDWASVAAVLIARPAPDAILGSVAVAAVTFTLTDGTTSPGVVVRCGLGASQHSPVCTDHPTLLLETPMGGYHDVPCGPGPGGEPGSSCATPLPTINPKAESAPLRIASRDFPLAVGHQEILVGQATLPNGILSHATFSLADPTTQAFTVAEGIQMVIRSTDPNRPPFDNAYQHGWHPGSEVVNVYLVLDVTSLTPGATLQVRNLVVR